MCQPHTSHNNRPLPELHANPGAAFSKVPRKILGKLLISLLLLLLLLHSFLSLRWTELIGLLVQCSTVALYPLDDVAISVSVAPKIRSFPKIFLGTFENVAPEWWRNNHKQTVNMNAGREWMKRHLSGGMLAWLSAWGKVQFAYGPADATTTHYLLLQ